MNGKVSAAAQGECLIAMYHYVRPMPSPGLPNFRAMDVAAFERQIDALAKDWTFISLLDYVEAFDGGKKLPAKSCLLTFDDGVTDHYEHAFPILRRRGISGAFFATSGPIRDHELLDVHIIQHLVARLDAVELEKRLEETIRRAAPADSKTLLNPDAAEVGRVYHYEPDARTRRTKYILNFGLPQELQRRVTLEIFKDVFGDPTAFAKSFYLTPEQLRKMADGGMVIGSHGHRHVPMSRCNLAQKDEELRLSRDLLTLWTGRPIDTFCFPWGNPSAIDAESEDVLRNLGYRCALTTLDGTNSGRISPFYLKRRDCIRLPMETAIA